MRNSRRIEAVLLAASLALGGFLTTAHAQYPAKPVRLVVTVSPGGAPDTGTGGSPDAGRHEGGTPVTAPVEGGAAGGGADRSVVPPDVGDGRDDDVVARQLREAAMKEKDPVLREKLWQEYREYKKSVGK